MTHTHKKTDSNKRSNYVQRYKEAKEGLDTISFNHIGKNFERYFQEMNASQNVKVSF